MTTPKTSRLTILLAAALVLPLTFAADMHAAQASNDPLKASEKDLQRVREARFGLFIHWGPVSIKGTEIGWSRGGERRGTGGKGPIPVEVYDNLYKRFNPIKFDADQWVAIAKATGMKYMVFTSKHHDGFSMFDSKLTEYKITNSPFKRDVVRELADACHKGGLRFGLYYSPPDWYHPDYRTKNHDRYVKFLHGQLREICTNYGKIDIIWFDGLGGKAKDWDSENLVKMIRKLQPGVIINNRSGIPCDHDTPEQTVGNFQINRPWETCMTICRQWAWRPNDKLKSLKECMDILVRCAGGDGNLLLNVGPMPTGEIEPRQVARLKEMGAWMKQYGQTIYATRGGPFMPGRWGASTHKGNTIYLHILHTDWPESPAVLPPINRKILSSKLLTGGTADVKQTDTAIEITVPPQHRQPISTIIELTLDGPAADIKPCRVSWGSPFPYKKVYASNVFKKMHAYAPESAFDDDMHSRWATDAGTHAAWIAVDLEKPATVARVKISEAYDRVREFELQYKDGQAWKTFHRGTTIGKDKTITFPPVTAASFRLDIKKATEGPTIWEIQLLPPKK